MKISKKLLKKTYFKAHSLAIMSFLIVLLTAVSVIAPPPQISERTLGFDVRSAIPDTIKQNTSFEVHFHVFNATSGLPINTGLSCYFHLYNFTGHHIYEGIDTTASHDFDYSFDIGWGNFTEIGDYTYIASCNDSNAGGFYAFDFEVTSNGKPAPAGSVIILFVSLFLIVIGFMLYQFILSMGHLASLDLDVVDLAKTMGLYFSLLGLYTLSIFYLGNPMIEGFLLLGIQIGAFTHILIPIIGFLISITIGGLKKKKMDFGTKRIYRRQKIG